MYAAMAMTELTWSPLFLGTWSSMEPDVRLLLLFTLFNYYTFLNIKLNALYSVLSITLGKKDH